METWDAAVDADGFLVEVEVLADGMGSQRVVWPGLVDRYQWLG